ncbi:hypothetical protein OV079_37300 [Nannocystis pusilla]|uniref:Uncharacterized protein n=1 Tax=Nannocystis pusilla TaxID=889268 RepID=A0A9X3J105_9BACT|nr:hypothetical protein [Nannocystis pusilla]MCY1011126.1 hypothetical protein [Nannocystis pusilla]
MQPHLSDVRAPDEVVLAIARLRLAQAAVEAAESLTDQILLRSPDSWEGHLLKAKVLLERGEPGLAQGELRLSRPPQPQADVELVAGKIAERGVASRTRCRPTAARISSRRRSTRPATCTAARCCCSGAPRRP